MSKIGLGIITCNREDFYQQCYNSVPRDAIDVLVTVNDGDKFKGNYPKSRHIHHKQNKGVGVSKNDALRHMQDNDCEHFFLIEDDIIIKDESVFEKYIETASESGLWHLMFGYHGPANKTGSKGTPVPRLVVEYDNNIKVAFNRHCVGAFCYYHKGVLKHAGIFDEVYKNVWEHVDHSYTIAKLGLVPGYWWWPDVANSYDYLDELACSEEVDKGAIRKRPDWEENISNGARHFYNKHNVMPTSVPDTPDIDIPPTLQQIKERYSKKYDLC